MNAFALLAERKSAISTKNFKRAGIAFISFLQLLFNKYLKMQSVFILLVLLSKDVGLINCENL